MLIQKTTRLLGPVHLLSSRCWNACSLNPSTWRHRLSDEQCSPALQQLLDGLEAGVPKDVKQL